MMCQSKLRLIFAMLAAALLMPISSVAIAKVNADLKQAENILKKYNEKNGVQIKLEMLTEKKVLGTKTTSKGIMTHQVGKLNLLLEGEKKSEMIFDGKKAYLIAYPDQELDPDGKRKVILLKVNGTNQLGLISNLFGNPKKFFSNFKIETVSKDDEILTLRLEDKTRKLKPMTLVFSKKNEALQKMTYLDDLGSEIQINFEKPFYTVQISSNLFKYNALKSDEVVNQ